MEIKVNLLVGDITRIMKSNGVERATEINGLKCLPDTFVPKTPWFNISKKDLKQIINKKEPKYTDISLIKLPKNIKEKFKNLKISEANNIDEIKFIQSSLEYRKTLGILNTYLSSISNNPKNITIHSLYFGNSNLSNNTYNSDQNTFIGLHLDSWEGNILNERIISRNRICINLGKEIRFLQFYNVSIDYMAELVSHKDNNDVNQIYKKFAAKFPDWPVYRISINPYEAYIAPTEFIIHDGSSIGTNTPDITLVARGGFMLQDNNIISKLAKSIKFFLCQK